MTLTFRVLNPSAISESRSPNTVHLYPDNWDDYGHKTLFYLTVNDEHGIAHKIGNTKIGFVGQNQGWTKDQLPQVFELLPPNFYSLGQDADFYENLVTYLSADIVLNILSTLGDVANDPNRLTIAGQEHAFTTSLLRSVNISSIEHQFKRILQGNAPLTEYHFAYEKVGNERYSGFKLEFKIDPSTLPSSNIHILIGRNGVGKTTILNNMVDALLPNRGEVQETGYFSIPVIWGGFTPLHDHYFAGLLSISFSAFDPFSPPDDQTNANAGMRYSYVGLKKRGHDNQQNSWAMKDKADLCKDFTDSLRLCFSLMAKKDRWEKAVRKLESDFNFAEMDLCQLVDIFHQDISENKVQFHEVATSLFKRMSSGHAVVLLTITKLVEKLEEKTLVLLDEPESHLHPPLLSAFTRALSDLLVNRNGVAIIATHSPVVLQEVPKSCVSILRRTRLMSNVDRPERETFGENVGLLTREVFGLEVSKSGFHDLLEKSVAEGKSYEEIDQEYQFQLGFEGRAILRSMLLARDTQGGRP